MITRRVLLASGAALAAPRLWAATETTLGDATVTTLSDGHLSLPESFLYGDLDPAAVDRIVAEAGVEGGLTPPCTLTLLRRGDALVLFDAGAGPAFMPTAGKLPEALEAAGIDPGDVTHVVFTHAHPDHLWGVLDDFDEPVFANAQHLMGAAELAYWTDPATLDTIAPERQAFAAGAARRLGMIEVDAFGDGDTVAPGVTAVSTPGHTPGHMSFEIAGERPVFVIGDAIGNGHVALARPDWPAPADQTPEQGAATRAALLERIAGQMAVGFHLPGGMGRIGRAGDGWSWTPA